MSTDGLALHGGHKTVQELVPFPTKIGKEELLEILSMWQFRPQTARKLRKLMESEPKVKGPHLFRYYNPQPSKAAAAEATLREIIGTRYRLAVNSCTSAFAASCRAIGIGAGAKRNPLATDVDNETGSTSGPMKRSLEFSRMWLFLTFVASCMVLDMRPAVAYRS